MLVDRAIDENVITVRDLEEIISRHMQYNPYGPVPTVFAPTTLANTTSVKPPHPLNITSEPDTFRGPGPGVGPLPGTTGGVGSVSSATGQPDSGPSQGGVSSSMPSPQENKRYRGFVKCYGKREGYGFITCAQLKGLYSQQDVFLHHIQIAELGVPLRRGDLVEFAVEENSNKQPQARRLKLLQTNVNGEVLLST